MFYSITKVVLFLKIFIVSVRDKTEKDIAFYSVDLFLGIQKLKYL